MPSAASCAVVLEGEIVMRQGEPGEHLFLVASGRFESRVQHSSHQWQPSAGTFIPRRFQILQRQALSARSSRPHGQFIRNYQAGEVFDSSPFFTAASAPPRWCARTPACYGRSVATLTAAMCLARECIGITHSVGSSRKLTNGLLSRETSCIRTPGCLRRTSSCASRAHSSAREDA